MRKSLVTVCCYLVAVALLGAGCGGSKKPADPGRAAVDKLVQAAADGDRDSIWDQVSEGTRIRLKTKERVAELVERELRPFTGGEYRTVVSQLITEQFGVVAIANGRAIIAIPLRKQRDDLRAEMGTVLRVEPIGPLPKVYDTSPAPQVAVRVKGGFGEATAAVIWIDGATPLDPHLAGDGSAATVFVNLTQPFAAGPHTVVSLFTTASQAGATAWRFTVRKKS